jgi:rRNA maturation protein Nop10
MRCVHCGSDSVVTHDPHWVHGEDNYLRAEAILECDRCHGETIMQLVPAAQPPRFSEQQERGGS